MLRLLCVAVFIQACFSLGLGADEGDYILVCKQEPIDLAIVLDSSSSIYYQEFDIAKTFLQDFLKQFDIGSGRNDVRVSIISYGKGMYIQHAFNLDTYGDKEGVIQAIGQIKHEAGLRTDTGAAIKYMRTQQMNDKVTRPWAEKVCIVITDGNSQRRTYTKTEAALARDQGIIMFAVGVGSVRMQELDNIAGNRSRVTRVRRYRDLDSIKELLASKTCIKKERPTTTPRPQTEENCAEDFPSDINFVFSPADLGTNATFWVTSVINRLVVHHNFGDKFRYGAVTGTCPEDSGFRLNEYQTPEEIKERLFQYERYRLPELVTRTTDKGFKEIHGGRSDARDVAILFVDGYVEDHTETQEKIREMLQRNIKVYVIDPYNTGIEFEGATTIRGTGSIEVARNLVQSLCEWDGPRQ